MGKQQQLSPEKYIITKARSLPIYKCYITNGWQEMKMGNVVVMRRHVNGNVTAGMYLVDLLCLGVKDTIYFFNIPEKELNESIQLDNLNAGEADYNLVHNVVYAAHDFAMEFDIKPEKNFSISKYILEEDDDNIPLIEVSVGDENGDPHLMVNSSYNYAPALQKLKQIAGEGNYTFTLGDDFDDEDDDDDDLDEYDEGELDEDDDDVSAFDDLDEGFLDFKHVAEAETEELEAAVDEQSRSFTELFIINAELLLRELNETENGVLKDYETLKKSKDFQLFEKKKEQWSKAYESSVEPLEKIFPQVMGLAHNEDGLDDEALMNEFLQLLDKYKSSDELSYMIVSAIPLNTLLLQIDKLESNFSQYTPAVQLVIAAYIAVKHDLSNTQYEFIFNASTVEMAYPFNRFIHSMHHRSFWLVQAILGIEQNDKEKILHYHNLLRVAGTGGHIKFLYAAQFLSWLSKYMGIETGEEEEDDDEEDYDDAEFDEEEDDNDEDGDDNDDDNNNGKNYPGLKSV